MKQNGLLERSAEAVAHWRANDTAALERLACEMQDSILGAPVPRRLRSQIFAEFDNLAKRMHVSNLRVALRSSAWGEGSDLGFGRAIRIRLQHPARAID